MSEIKEKIITSVFLRGVNATKVKVENNNGRNGRIGYQLESSTGAWTLPINPGTRVTSQTTL